MAGRVGFVGMDGPELTNRFKLFGHSGYFLGSLQKNYFDDYMRAKWVPLILDDAPIKNFDERAVTGPLGGMAIWLTNNFEPIKISAYTLPFVALALYWGALLIETSLSQSRVKALVALYDNSSQGAGASSDELLLTFRRALRLPLRRTTSCGSTIRPRATSTTSRPREFGTCFDLATSTLPSYGPREPEPPKIRHGDIRL